MTDEVKYIVTIGFDNLNWVSVLVTWRDRHWVWLARLPLKLAYWVDDEAE